MKSRLITSVSLVCLLLTAIPVSSHGQGTLEDYERAEKFHQFNIRELVFKLQLRPHWINEGARFWYRNDTREGKEFMLVDPGAGVRALAFDHAKVAEALSKALGKQIEAGKLPFDTFMFIEKNKAIAFEAEGKFWRCDLSTYECRQSEGAVRPPESDDMRWGMAWPDIRMDSPSPDGRWVAFARDYNLFVKSVDSGDEVQLTFDGTEDYYYSVEVPSPRTMVQQGTEKVELPVIAYWSPDSKRLFTFRMDVRGAAKMYLVQAVPPEGVRPKLFTFAYPLPGEINVPYAEGIIFELDTGKRIDVKDLKHPLLYYGQPWLRPQWLDGRHMTIVAFERGWRTVRLSEVNAETGEISEILVEKGKTVVEPYTLMTKFFNDGSEFLWTSQRDGWHHIYHYETAGGKLVKQMTEGEYFVHSIDAVDEENRQVYFSAGGREKDRDPYLRHLYRVNLDGSGLTLLTPEAADHSVFISPDFSHFVDTYSLVNTVPRSVLRSCADGKTIMELEEADIENLLAAGWRMPEPFKVKARDGKTDIYGVIYRPANFDPAKKYPVIDNIYTGPHHVMAPKSFTVMLSRPAQSAAELGFIVINIDGLGTAKRSKEFHDFSYMNLADGGIPDHIAGMKQLAEKYPYMDLDRVGVFGFSAGGYDSAHAIFAHPDFYKVAVAASGNYDHRMDKATWNEMWMDYPVRQHYIEQSCLTIAHQLKGKLFLAHGELDENVNPYNTIRLVDKLIQANKDFDLLIVPNKHHYLGDHPYFVRKRWDFFVRHLHGVEPPQGYRIKEFER